MSALRILQELIDVLGKAISTGHTYEIDTKVQVVIRDLLIKLLEYEKQAETPDSGFDVSQHNDAGS